MSGTYGYWGPPSSSVDWCEPNYMYSYYIAEWWNTLSNIPPVVFSLTGMVLGGRAVASLGKTRQPSAILSAYWVPFIVFVGSFCFHATLTYTGQLLDELPMILGSLYLHYCLNGYGAGVVPSWLLLAAAVAIIFFMIVLRDSPLPLQLSYGILVLGLVYRSIMAISSPIGRQNTRILCISAVVYGSGFVLWIIDQTFCSFVQGLAFHAWWHLLTGTGTYLHIQFLCSNQLAHRRKPYKWVKAMGMPFCEEVGAQNV